MKRSWMFDVIAFNDIIAYFLRSRLKTPGAILCAKRKALGSRESLPMKNAQCEGRLATLEAARRGFSDSFLEVGGKENGQYDNPQPR